MSSSERRSGVRKPVAAAIVEAAAAVFAARGDAANMGDVASAAGVARSTVYRYFPSRGAMLDALGSFAVEDAGDRLAAARLDEIAVEEAFTRAVRALVVVGDYLVVLTRERGRVGGADFDRRIGGALVALVERGRELGEIRQDLTVSWLAEALIGIIVNVQRATPGYGVEDKSEKITSLFLNGARVRIED